MEIYSSKPIKKRAIKNIEHFKHVVIKNINDSIKHLQNKFTITYVDKSQNATICNEYYKPLLHNAINTSDIFKKTILKIAIHNRKLIYYQKLLKIKCKKLNYPYLVIIQIS